MSTLFNALLLVVLAQGVSDERILIGMEGKANSFSVDEENLGMRLVIRQANETGGIHGRMLVEKAYPRGSDNPVDQAVRNAQRLVEQDGVFLLFNFGGPAAVRIGEYAMERDVPYLFPHTALLTVERGAPSSRLTEESDTYAFPAPPQPLRLRAHGVRVSGRGRGA